MWLVGLSHVLTRTLAVGYNLQLSVIPVGREVVTRRKHAYLVKHDVSKEVTTRFCLQTFQRQFRNANRTKFQYDGSFKLSHRPRAG